MTGPASLHNVAIVLHRPRFPENIGAAARAMCNMGISRLIVVAPENCDLSRVCKMATHAALDVVEQMMVFQDLESALADFNYVLGTTARLGGERQVVHSPETAADKLAPLLASNQIALVFGPEDRGLSNRAVRRCDGLINIPTADFTSLNLAQAVMVVCYTLFSRNRPAPKSFAPKLACRQELDAMYAQLQEVLIRISFINPQNPDYFMNNLRRFFSRIHLRARDVRLVRGVCRQINWYGAKCYQDGQTGQAPPVEKR